jgi:TM2 domain-containing membrane protein YozV
MTSAVGRKNSYQQPPRDPGQAAILSLFLPGLGQLYNGETRKGWLFIAATFINWACFLLMLFMKDILRAMVEFGLEHSIWLLLVSRLH